MKNIKAGNGEQPADFSPPLYRASSALVGTVCLLVATLQARAVTATENDLREKSFRHAAL